MNCFCVYYQVEILNAYNICIGNLLLFFTEQYVPSSYISMRLYLITFTLKYITTTIFLFNQWTKDLWKAPNMDNFRKRFYLTSLVHSGMSTFCWFLDWVQNSTCSFQINLVYKLVFVYL